ncbi:MULTISPECIES: hypothetical protein [unclassified Polaribacter]|uniref:hypothetical protein n=1 Tax=unclassified Polaribacter TaxID=196858 RepID=UPI0011BDC004|nr:MULTISPECIES: hypothetical protein [unclassified Polaribacter]TXD50758.1 hypothetical protein ES043_14745 [Polaribacter sp. IC063]TXD57458.1 hypothetical protein ES044_15025 [Polaribacter sp. IC066]
MNLTHTHIYWKFCSLFLVMLFLSCTEDTNIIDQNNIEDTTEKTINFKGLVFKNSYNLSEEDLNAHKKEGFKTILLEKGKAYYKSKGLSPKTAEELDNYRLLEATRSMLPYLPFQEDGINEAMILRDLPELTAETLYENQDIIDDYYNSSLDRIVATRYFDNTYVPIPKFDGIYDLEDYTPKPPFIPIYKEYKNQGETTADCVLRLADIKWFHVRRGVALFTADRDANSNAYKYYPNLNKVNTKRDAFRIRFGKHF